MNFLTSLRTLLLAIILSIGISYTYAAWSPPSVAPTGGNAEAPVNVGGATQVKAGALTVNGLLSVGSFLSAIPGPLILRVFGKIGADEYCDRNGANCTAATALGGSGSTGDISVVEVFPAVPQFSASVPPANNTTPTVGSWSLGGYTLVNTRTINVPISGFISGSPIDTTCFRFILNIDGTVGSIQSGTCNAGGPGGAVNVPWSSTISIPLPSGVHSNATLTLYGNNITGGTVNVGPVNAVHTVWYSL